MAKKLVLEFGKESAERIEEVCKMINADRVATVARRALAVYTTLVEETVLNNADVVLRYPDGTEKVIEEI